MLAGFVLATPVRRAVFRDIAAGEQRFDRIVAKHRLVRPVAERALADLREKGIVEENETGLRLTDAGEKLRLEIGRLDLE